MVPASAKIYAIASILSTSAIADNLTDGTDRYQDSEIEVNLTAENQTESCSFKTKNLPDLFEGIKVPGYVRFSAPEGYSRLTFEGTDGYRENETCRLVVDVSNTPDCGIRIWEILYKGTNALTNVSGIGIDVIADPIPSGTKHLSIIDTKYNRQLPLPHVRRPGITFRDKGPTGLLSFPGETKFFGQSIDTLESYENTDPLFPAAKQLSKCNNLVLTNQESFTSDPYYEGIPYFKD